MILSSIGQGVKFGLSKSASGIAHGVNAAFKYNVAGPALQSALYFGASNFVDSYAEGNFDSTGARLASSVLSMGLGFKGYQKAFGAVTRGVGGIAGDIAKFQRGRSQVFGPPEATIFDTIHQGIGYGSNFDKRFIQSGFRSLFRESEVGKSRRAAYKKGLISKKPTSTRPIVRAAKAVGAFPFTTVRGGYEYAKTFGAALSSGQGQSWATLGTGLSSIRNPFAPAIFGGMAAGAGMTMVRNHNYFQGGAYSPDPAPIVYGPGVPDRQINRNMYGGGISYGRPSAINGRSVRRGQEAVTASMLMNRKI